MPHAEGNRWVGRLLPLAVGVLVFALLEGGARLATQARFGKARQGEGGEILTYAPYVMSLYPKDRWVYSPPPKDPAKWRLVVVGSSTANKLTDAELVAAFQPYVAKPVEVFNLAQGGYIANQELTMLALYGMDFQPDLVLSLGGLNDFVAMSKTGRPGVPTDDETLEKAMSRPALYAADQLTSGSQLITVAKKLGERRDEVRHLRDEALVRETAAGVARAMGKMAMLCRGAGVRYVGVLQPYLHLRRQPTEAEARLGRNYLYRRPMMTAAMRRLESELPAGVLSALPAFDDRPGLSAFVDEAHLTPEGRRALLEYIVKRTLGKSDAL